MGGVTNCPSPSTECSATIRTAAQLEAPCASPLSIQLEADCGCGPPAATVGWNMSPQLDGMTLSNDGKLGGTPDAGVYEFKATAILNSGPNAKRDFTLTVTSPCRVVTVSDDSETGDPTLQATRLDGEGQKTTTLPTSPLEDAVLTSFDVSSDGAFLARVVASSEGNQLELMRTGRSDTTLESLDYTGEHLAHAFSPDSRYLALVTQQAGEETQRLWLFDLSTSLEASDSISIRFKSHLTWAAADWLLFFGASSVLGDTSDTEVLAVQEVFVSDGRVVREREQADIIYYGTGQFQGFLVGAGGFLAVDRFLPTFAAREEGMAHRHPPIEALSPDLAWMTHDFNDGDGARVDRVTEPYEEMSFATASRCDVVLAWSKDGSKFLCRDSDSLRLYSTRDSGGSLDSVELEISGGFDRTTYRMAFSDSGDWLAVVPNPGGLFLANTSELDASNETLELDSPVLGASEIDEWNFFFSSREDRIVVQRGNRLSLASLDGEGTSDFEDVSKLVLPVLPACSGGWFPSPDAWCGAPKFLGGWVLSQDESQLALADASGDVQVVNLATRHVVDAGPLSISCADADSVGAPTLSIPRCVQFQ